MNHIPKITVIVAVYNCAKTLQQCIDSFVNQSYLNKELIIIDGASIDGSVEILIENQDHINYWVSEPDKGIYNAWNKGLKKANGDWICFLGADDFFWDDFVLEKISTDLILSPPDVRVVYGKVMMLNLCGQDLYLSGEHWSKVKKRFRHAMSIPHQAVMHKKSLFELHGNFNESFQIVGDYELLLRELKTQDAVFVPNVIVAGMRLGGISSNPSQSLKLLHELRYAQTIHGQKLPSIFWLTAEIKVLIRVYIFRLFGEKVGRKILDLGRCILGKTPYWTTYDN